MPMKRRIRPGVGRLVTHAGDGDALYLVLDVRPKGLVFLARLGPGPDAGWKRARNCVVYMGRATIRIGA